MTNIESVTIPDSVVELGDRCFLSSGLRSVTFGRDSQLVRIGAEAFMGTNIESMSIPDSVVELGDWCFCACDSLITITFGASSSLEHVGVEAYSMGVNIAAPDNIHDIIRHSDLVRYKNLKDRIAHLICAPIDEIIISHNFPEMPTIPMMYDYTLVVRAGVQKIQGSLPNWVIFEEGAQLQSAPKEVWQNVETIFVLGEINWEQDAWDDLPTDPIYLNLDMTSDAD